VGRIKTWYVLRSEHYMLRFPHKNDDLYLQLFVGGFVSYLRCLCLVAYCGVQHIVCCVFGLFSSCVLYTLCCQFLWIVNFWLHLRYFLMFMQLVHGVYGLPLPFKVEDILHFFLLSTKFLRKVWIYQMSNQKP
jgi:hypothetical protein